MHIHIKCITKTADLAIKNFNGYTAYHVQRADNKRKHVVYGHCVRGMVTCSSLETHWLMFSDLDDSGIAQHGVVNGVVEWGEPSVGCSMVTSHIHCYQCPTVGGVVGQDLIDGQLSSFCGWLALLHQVHNHTTAGECGSQVLTIFVYGCSTDCKKH